MQNFWFNLLDGKGGRNTTMNSETSFPLKFCVAWRAEQCTFCFSQCSPQLNLFYQQVSTDSKAVLTSYFDKVLKFEITGREGTAEAFFLPTCLKCWTGEKPIYLNLHALKHQYFCKIWNPDI